MKAAQLLPPLKLRRYCVGLNKKDMESIYSKDTILEIKKRLDKLSPDSQRLWGTMDVSQMLAHCSAAIESAVSDDKGKMTIVGFLFGGIAKKVISSDKPFKQNLPTAKEFIVADKRNFEQEKEFLKNIIDQLVERGTAGVDGKIHPFFGKLSVTQWSDLVYKHLDHHLRQFGA